VNEKAQDIADFWSRSPETYGTQHGATSYGDTQTEFGTPEFFAKVDATFMEWNQPLHRDRPFDRIFPYDSYKGKRVFEIGCGMGTMAQLWATNGAEYHGVDLSPMSVAMTSRRFELLGRNARVSRADARALPFPDHMFDYGYSWGVLHHSPDLARSLREFIRVLKPNAEFGLMLYNRRSFRWWYFIRLRQGLLHAESLFLGPLELASRYTDDYEAEGNPHTWPVTEAEVRAMLDPYADRISCRVLGMDLLDLFPHVLPGIGQRLPTFLIKPWARRIGWSLWFSGRRRG
jgi:SAM-dependent methyltransferase